MKISIIHNLYKRNPYVLESVLYNLHALEQANADYQYILFNDNGDVSIKEDIAQVLSKRVVYFYSDYNFGQGKCSGGWVGALPLVEGEIVHNTGQDDVFTSKFYEIGLESLKDEQIKFFSSNGIATDEKLNQKNILIHPISKPDYTDPVERFKEWFGVIGDSVTRANNNLLAPGTIYKTELHSAIGEPSLDEFLGCADFEYWARMLFYGHKGIYLPEPTWLYRQSDFSISQNEKSRHVDHRPPYIEKIKNKYSNLWKERQQ